jgi:hypothetical protein
MTSGAAAFPAAALAMSGVSWARPSVTNGSAILKARTVNRIAASFLA